MAGNWEASLHEYVNRMNRAQLLCSTDPLLSGVEDEDFMRMQQARLRNAKESLEQRSAQIVRCVTRLKVIHVAQNENKVKAEIRMHKERVLQCGKERYAEQWEEQEWVVLEKSRGSWAITSVKPVVHEKGISSEEQLLSDSKTGLNGAMINGEMPFSAFRETLRDGESETLPRAAVYDRLKVQQYADMWWNRKNPEFPDIKVDCTNYVSQCLFAGGAPMNYTGKRNSGWWLRKTAGNTFDWSYSWAVSNSLEIYFRTSKKGLRGISVERPDMLQVGDVIFYDWDGNGAYQHTAVVTGLDFNGMPLVNAHTVNSKRRYWDYRDSYAWSQRTRYRFYRIADRWE